MQGERGERPGGAPPHPRAGGDGVEHRVDDDLPQPGQQVRQPPLGRAALRQAGRVDHDVERAVVVAEPVSQRVEVQPGECDRARPVAVEQQRVPPVPADQHEDDGARVDPQRHGREERLGEPGPSS